MKRSISVLLTLVFLLSLTACSGQTVRTNGGSSAPGSSAASGEPVSSAPATPTPSPSPEPTPEPTVEPTPEPKESESGKTLVVYYSATGSTEAAANTIAATTGGDTFELEPAEPYTSEDLDWTTDGSRVNREHDDEGLRDIALTSTTVENWDSYDTVFIGYPIWWGVAAWPVNSFIKNNDFSGKTVIPFCTSSSSGLGESGELLASMAGTGDWQEGRRFQSGASEDTVREWVGGLGLQW